MGEEVKDYREMRKATGNEREREREVRRRREERDSAY